MKIIKESEYFTKNDVEIIAKSFAGVVAPVFAKNKWTWAKNYDIREPFIPKEDDIEKFLLELYKDSLKFRENLESGRLAVLAGVEAGTFRFILPKYRKYLGEK